MQRIFLTLQSVTNHRVTWRVAFLALVLCNSAQALAEPALADKETTAAPQVAAVSASLQQFVERGDLAGAVALVAQGGQLRHLAAVGYADVETQRPMQTDNLFSIMSMTKPVAAVAALICCDDGKLTLDDPLARWLPEFDQPPNNTITLRHVLTHTSGLFSDQRNIGSLAETVAKLAKQKLQFTPGERWQYSPGLTVAGRAAEVASGMPFDEFVDKRICQPLGMRDTSFRLAPADRERLATTYAYNSREKLLTPAKLDFLGPMETRSPNPSAGLYSTAADLFRFYQMLLEHGELNGVRILEAETVAEMVRPQTGQLKAGFVPGSVWGLGVGLVQQPEGITAMLSPGTFGHGGMLGTQAWADPVQDAVFLLLIQRVGVPNSDASEYRQAFQQSAVAALNTATARAGAAATLDAVTLENVVEPAANSADEPLAASFSLDQAVHFMDSAAVAWQKRRNCMTCHTNYAYLMVRPALEKSVPRLANAPAHGIVRQFAEDLVDKRWPEKGPRWDAEVVMTGVILALHDRATTGKLHPLTRQALDRIWTVQRDDGGFDWLKCEWPPMESDDHFGATMAAIGVAAAPEDYAKLPDAAAGLEKLRGYLRREPAPTLHHRLMLVWADTELGGVIEPSARQAALDELWPLQHADGGWAIAQLGPWEREDGTEQDLTTSDAYGTGFAAYVARRAGVASGDTRLVRAADWLLANQRASGRWHVRSVHADGEHFISHAGTAFALLALDACGRFDTAQAKR